MATKASSKWEAFLQLATVNSKCECQNIKLFNDAKASNEGILCDFSKKKFNIFGSVWIVITPVGMIREDCLS